MLRNSIQNYEYLTQAHAIDSTATDNIVNLIMPVVGWEVPFDEAGTYYGDVSWTRDPDTWDDAKAYLLSIIGEEAPQNIDINGVILNNVTFK